MNEVSHTPGIKRRKICGEYKPNVQVFSIKKNLGPSPPSPASNNELTNSQNYTLVVTAQTLDIERILRYRGSAGLSFAS